MKNLGVLFLILEILSFAGARAADFTTYQWYGRSYHIMLKGDIVSGDEETFKTEVLKQIRAGHLVSTIQIYSRGGDVDAAMSIGEQVRLLQMQTQSPEYSSAGGSSYNHICRQGALDAETAFYGGNCTCASACFIVWSAGIGRRGDYVGIHHPFFNPEQYSSTPIAEARAMYAKMQVPVTSFFNKMKIPDYILTTMWANNSKQVHFLEANELAALRNSDPAIDEYIVAKCGVSPNGTIFANSERKQYVDCKNNIEESVYALASQDYLDIYGNSGEKVPGLTVEQGSDPASPKTVTRTPDAEQPAPNVAAEPLPQPVTITPKPSTRVFQPETANSDYFIRNNRDLVSSDLAMVRNSDQDSCSRACSGSDTCEGFSFDEWNRLCILKTSIKVSKIQPRSISAVKKSALSKFPDVLNAPIYMQKYRGTYFTGTGNANISASSTEDCEAQCKNSRQCVTYTYFKKENTCRMFKSSGEYFHGDSNATDSGVKVQP